MKKIITLALIIGATTFTQAQGNLVFNQVLIVELVTGEEQTVPEGKVWKVESGSDWTRTIKVDGSAWSTNTPDGGRNLPAWFPAGTILKVEGSNNSKRLSILEFNVVAISSGSGGGSGGGGVSSDGLIFSGMINQFIPTSSVTGIGTVAGSFTVPEGKVWKISTMTHKKIASSGQIIAYNGSLCVGMDGVPIYTISSSVMANGTLTNNIILTPGTYELKWYATSGGNNYCGTYTHLVAIEYNLP